MQDNGKTKIYTSIFIDLDDTLYDFSAASREAFKETYDLLGYNRFFDSFEEYMHYYTPRNLELWELYGKGQITKEELNAIRYSYPLECVGINNPTLASQFCKEALGRIPTKNKLIPGTVELLQYLRPKYRLYILSNGFTELQSKKMKTAHILHYFDDIILSEDIGCNKPHPAIFKHALEKTASKVEESIMIGDMLETDIAGAANVGMEQIYLNRKGDKTDKIHPTYEVNSLTEIMGIL